MDGRMSLLTSPFVPEGMVDLMKKLSKSVIKERPTNIYEFAADFFERMLIERDGSLDKGYGKFRSYTEYCKFMDKMEQRRLTQPTKKVESITTIKDITDSSTEEVDPPCNIEVQGIAIQGVERKSKDSSKDSVKNVSINPKYQSQSEKVLKPVVSNVSSNAKSVKAKPRKLSSKKPSENLIVIKEETSGDDDENGNSGESNLHRAASTIQKAFRVYLSNKNDQNENVTDASQLSENAAALIIQKAFKFLIQKIKPSTSNPETIGKESNNNEVLAVAGQETCINSEKIKNNNDENSEQILREDIQDDTVIKQDLELKENDIEDALDDTATTSEMELKENFLEPNLKEVTASDVVAQQTDNIEDQNGDVIPNDIVTIENPNEIGVASDDTVAQQADNKEDQNAEIVPNDNVSIESHNKINIAPYNITESSTDQHADILPKNNEEVVTSDRTTAELVADPNTEKIGETIPDEVPFIEQHKSTENNVNDTEGQDVEMIASQRVESRSDNVESNESQVENTSEDTSAYGTDSQVDFEPSHATDISDDTLSQPDAENREEQEVTRQLEKESENQKDNEIDHTASEQSQTTTAFGTTDTAADINPPIVEDTTETEVLDVLDENITVANLDRSEVAEPDHLKDNALEDTKDESELNAKPTDMNVDTEENIEETETNKQLFLVENDGIYVNLDVLQDKLGQIAIDDGAGTDSEKSFKLNILEREEILVNQENFQQMGDDRFEKAKDTSADDKIESADVVVTQKDNYFEEVDNKTDFEGKEDEGNEEYELAETVVLVDYPLRLNSGGKHPNTDESSSPDVKEINEEIAVEKHISVTTVEPLKGTSKVTQQNQSYNESEPNSEPDMKMNTDADQQESKEDTLKGSTFTEIGGNESFAKEVETNIDNINELEGEQNSNGDPANIEKSNPENSEQSENPLSDTDKQHKIESETQILEETKMGDKNIQEDGEIQNKDEAEIISSMAIEEASGEYPDLQTTVDQLLKSEDNENETEIISSPAIEVANEKCPDLQTTDDQLLKSEENENEAEIISSPAIEVADEKCPDLKTADDQLLKSEEDETEAEIISSPAIEEANEKCPDFQTADDQLLKSEENEKLVKAATVIQKVFRGYIVRSSAQKANTDKNELRLSAALIIQKYVRGYLVRRYLHKANNFNRIRVTSNDIKENQDDANIVQDAENTEKTELVPKLPNYSNRFLIPKDSFLERESFADDEDYTRTCKELAATSIQKTYRGYRVRRSLKPLSDSADGVPIKINGDEEISDHPKNDIEFSKEENEVETVVNEAERVISEVLCVATDVLPLTLDADTLEKSEDKTIEQSTMETRENLSITEICPDEPSKELNSVLGQIIRDNIHVEGQMQQKYNQMAFQDSAMNPIEEMSDSSDQPDTPVAKSMHATVPALESVDSKFDGIKSFSYEQLSSDLSDTEENKRESLKESEVDDTSRDERDDLSEVENFDLSSCGEDSLEAMYYSLRKNEIMLDRMQKQVAEQRDSKSDEIESVVTENLKTEFPERVTENLDAAMDQVFKSMESSSEWDVGGKDEDDNSSTLDLGLDDSSSINDEKEIETSRHVKRLEEINYEDEQSDAKDNENNGRISQSSESNFTKDVELNTDQSQQSDSSLNSSTRFIMKSQSVSEDMMNPIMFAMKRKQALLDQMHVHPYPLKENLSEEDHDAFPEHLLSDIDIGNIQRKIFASSVSETDSDYIEPNTTNRRLVRDDFNISTALDHLSTDSDSTIVSAATKIQAGARGFLTRRRLRRTSAGGTSISFEKRYSFGNAAIDKSLEDLIKRQEQINLDGAALKIQQQYRRYQARKKNLKKVSPIREQTLELSGGSSIEGFDEENIGITEITLAQKQADHSSDEENVDHLKTSKDQHIRLNIDEVDTVQPVKSTPVNQRRLTLQRGDAVQRNSRPDSPDPNTNVKEVHHTSTDNPGNEKFKDSETGEYTGSIVSKPEKKVTPYINIQSLINRGIGPRQRSMPVQIDSELMRIIPKHLRKRVKSADIAKKKKNY